MDTRELRRGNWILFEETGTEFEVEQIFANGLKTGKQIFLEDGYFST